MRKVISSTLMLTALAVFVVASVSMLRGREPFSTWFYCFAWWSYIVFVETFLFRRGGKSDLFESPLRFLSLSLLSISIWLVFEMFNFRLQNWHYLEVPLQTVVRWVGYALSFSTVLPAIFATTRLLEHLGVFKHSASAALKKPQRFFTASVGVGIVCLITPLLWPKYFFPLVWGAFIFLCEPLNYRLGGPSLLLDWEEGSLRKFYLLLISGMWCGFLWEFWNFWAGSKWYYTVPYVGSLKIFEMPVLGFLGFPPFAVECYVMVNSLSLLNRRMEERWTSQARGRAWVLLGIGLALFDMMIFLGIDHFTVISFRK